MTIDAAQVLGEALAALRVTDEGPIGAPGGQKIVRRVSREGKTFVLKIVVLDFATDETLKRAEREVELLASLESPNVVRVESALVELGVPVHAAAWIEEYLDGNDLGELLNGEQWSWDDTRSMGMQVANGLAAGHEKSVIHRDLSATNVRRISDKTYKVLDFGFARHTLRSGLTVAGQPGTPGHLTPEHLNSYSGGPTQMSDVFQLGILMYTALAGVSPYPWQGDEHQYVQGLQDGAMPPLSDFRSDLSSGQSELVLRSLHQQPARRFRNAAALRDELERTL